MSSTLLEPATTASSDAAVGDLSAYIAASSSVTGTGQYGTWHNDESGDDT